MQSGHLRQRVMIQQKVVTRNSFNEEIVTWSDIEAVWAEVVTTRRMMSEHFAALADQVQAKVPYQVRLRYRAGLSPATHQLLWQGSTLEVEGVADADGRRRELLLMCYEVQR